MHSFKTTYVVKVHHFEKIHYCSHRINRNKCFNHLRKDFRFWVSWYLVFLFWALSAIVVMLRKREQKAVRGTIFFLKKKGPFFTFSLMILRILRQLWDISYFPGKTLRKPVRKETFWRKVRQSSELNYWFSKTKYQATFLLTHIGCDWKLKSFLMFESNFSERKRKEF